MDLGRKMERKDKPMKQRLKDMARPKIPRRHLTKKQIEAIIFVGGVIGTFRPTNKSFWDNWNVTPEWRSQIDKVVEEVSKLSGFFKCNNDEIDKLKEMISDGKYNVRCISELDYQEHKKNYRKKRVEVALEDLDTIKMNALGSCENCDRNVSACQLRLAFKNTDTDYYDPERTNKCEYCLKRRDAKK